MTRAPFFMRHKNTFDKPGVRGAFHVVGIIVIIIGILLIFQGISIRSDAQNIDTKTTEDDPLFGSREKTDMDKLQEKNEKDRHGSRGATGQASPVQKDHQEKEEVSSS